MIQSPLKKGEWDLEPSDLEDDQDKEIRVQRIWGANHIIPLWPCPLCGGDAFFLHHIQAMSYTAECSKCGLQLGYPYGYSSRLDLCRDWNRCFNGVNKDDETNEI